MASLSDALGALLPLHEDTLRELDAIKSDLPTETLAWAVHQLVMANRDPDMPRDTDALERARELAPCRDHDRLLLVWTRLMRELVGLPRLDETQLQRMVEANVISLTTVDGFSMVARQLAAPSSRLTTEIQRPPSRPSTPPLRRVATPPTPAVELALR